MIRRPPRSTRTDTLLSLHDALPISLLLKGAIEVGIAGQTHASESGPSVNLFVSRHEWQLHHRFSSLSSLQYLTLHLDAEAADELLGDADALLPEGMAHHRADRKSTRLNSSH